MTPYYADDWLTVMLGDCRQVMAEMEPESVHCVVTSPPYWGLRDYGTATWEGGEEACDHLRPPTSFVRNAGRDRAASGGTFHDSPNMEPATAIPFRDVCGKCGAHRIDSQLGLEPTPEAYVESMVAVFREVRRVLRSDGTVWLNLGDSYSGGTTDRNDQDRNRRNENGPAATRQDRKLYDARAGRPRAVPTGLKPKDLVGIPWRVAFALQADGWYLRSDIIWAKPNPMPESVTDRPTKAHEYLFLLSKSPRYYFDADAVREAAEARPQQRLTPVKEQPKGRLYAQDGNGHAPTSQGGTGTHRNLRSVWTIATQPYPGAHFATFPQALVEPCIKAGTSERGVCPECGAPWERVVEVQRAPSSRDGQNSMRGAGHFRTSAGGPSNREGRERLRVTSQETTGWQPTCRCEHDGGGWVPVPATVLDPFAGSGTTGLVAQRLSRRAVLIDLNGEYLEQVMDRNRDIPLGLGA
jgi:DNA modification methylase